MEFLQWKNLILISKWTALWSLSTHLFSISRGIYSRISFGGMSVPHLSTPDPISSRVQLASSLAVMVLITVFPLCFRVDLVRTDVYWQNQFTVGTGGTIPANSTGNSLIGGNSSVITAGMYDCTALKDAKRQVSIGLIGTYGAGILFTAIVMTVVRGKNPSY
jgi:hypothetical protein